MRNKSVNLEAAKKICKTILIDDNQDLKALDLITKINIKQENFEEALKYSNLQGLDIKKSNFD